MPEIIPMLFFLILNSMGSIPTLVNKVIPKQGQTWKDAQFRKIVFNGEILLSLFFSFLF